MQQTNQSNRTIQSRYNFLQNHLRHANKVAALHLSPATILKMIQLPLWHSQSFPLFPDSLSAFHLNISRYIIMYSDSQSVRQTFAYPPETPTLRENNSGKSFNRKPLKQEIPIKDQLYFKLKVLKHVGQLVANLKSSIALFSHDLNQHQLSYLQCAEDHVESEGLLREDNLLLLFVQSILWVLLWINLWKSSFEMVFERLQYSYLISVITIAVYCCYLLVYFNSKLRNERQELILLRSVIAKNYFLYRFPQLVPFFVAGFIELAFQPQNKSFLYYLIRIIPISLIPEISILYRNLENVISSESKGEILIMFAKLLGKIVIFLHLISLLLNSAKNLEDRLGYDTTWVEAYSPHNFLSAGELYLLGWYWASTILCTVGFGDIVPIDNLERGLISFLEVFSALIFGYFVNYIGSLIKMQGEKTDIFETNLRKLNRYLSKANIPGALKREARAHFFDREEIVKTYNQEEEVDILGNLNNQIKKDILQYSNLEVLKTASLAKILSADLLRSIAFKMHKVIYAPEQTIYSPEDRSAEKLWVIEKGKVIQRWYNSSGKEFKNIALYTHQAHENVLGWINFLKEQTYRLSAKCQAFSILHEINRQDFFSILKENRQNFLSLMESKDQMIFMQKKYVSRCLCCSRFSHSTVDCPKIHLPKKKAQFLFGRAQSQSLFGKSIKRSKKVRSDNRYNWRRRFQCEEYDPNTNHQEQTQLESTGYFQQSQRMSSLKQMDLKLKRPSVDEVIEYVKRCSVKLIENKQEGTSTKRLSSKMDLMSDCTSNKHLLPPIVQSPSLINFDRLLADETGYFKQANYSNVLHRHAELKGQGRKKRL